MGDLTVTNHSGHFYYPTTPEQVQQQAAEPPEPPEGWFPNQLLAPLFLLDGVRDELSLTHTTMQPYMDIVYEVIWKHTYNRPWFLVSTKAEIDTEIVQRIRLRREGTSV